MTLRSDACGIVVALERRIIGGRVAPNDDDFVTPNENGPVSLDDRLRAYETRLIASALEATGGNKSKAAALLHVKRSTLGDRIKQCGLGGHHAESNC